jgi:hypothetical protein
MARDFITSALLNESEIIELLNKIPDNEPLAASDFFVRFGLAPLYHQERFFEALERGHEILHLIARLNPTKYEEMHKGYAFYFMGMAAYRLHDFQSAIFYIDATLSEDIKNFPNDTNTPPHLFLRLEGDDPRQAAQMLTQGAQTSIEEYAKLYNDVLKQNNLGIPHLTIEHIRSDFLRPSSLNPNRNTRSLASTFITFFLEFKYRDFQLRLRREPGTNEPMIIHLYKGCLLFESLLKNNPLKQIRGRTLKPALSELKDELHLDFSTGFDINADSLGEALASAVAGNDEITSYISVTGKLRNTLSHNLGWPSQITPEQYLHGFLQVSIACLHALATLYRK